MEMSREQECLNRIARLRAQKEAIERLHPTKDRKERVKKIIEEIKELGQELGGHKKSRERKSTPPWSGQDSATDTGSEGGC